IGCYLALLLYTTSVVQTLYITWITLKANTGNIASYFDFLNHCSVNIGFYVHVYVNCFRVDLVEVYVEALQSAPVTVGCQTSIRKAKYIAMYLCAQAMFQTFSWFVTLFQMDVTNFNTLFISSQNAARELFWWDRNATVEPSTLFVAAGFLGRLFNACFINVSLDSFITVQLCCVYFQVSDYFDYILANGNKPADVIKMIDHFKELMQKTNSYIRLYVFQFILMTLTFYAIHCFDGFSEFTPKLWKAQMCMYYCLEFSNFYLMCLIYLKLQLNIIDPADKELALAKKQLHEDFYPAAFVYSL
ncbi:unnamed protein product, partial [Allacma fusca]